MPSPPPPTPLHYWALDEASGAAAAAGTGSTPVALSAVVGTPSVAAGKHGNCRGFSNSPASSLGQAADDASMVLGPAFDWTLSFWLNYNVFALPAGGNITIINRSGIVHVNLMTSGGLRLYASTAAAGDYTYVVSGTIGDDAWHHVVVRFNSAASSFTTTVDGASAAPTVIGGTALQADAATGRFSFGNNAIYLDEVALWRSAPGAGGSLSDAEVAALYNAGAGSFWDGAAWSGIVAGTGGKGRSALFSSSLFGGGLVH